MVSVDVIALNFPLQVVTYMLEQQVANVCIDLADSLGGETPLSAASLAGHTSLVQYLVEQSASVNSVNTRGMPPLLAASKVRYL